jgi:hypothetical protein
MSIVSDVFSLPVHFWIICNLLLLFSFCQVCLLVKETAEIETGIAKSLAGSRQTYGKNKIWFGEIERKLAKLSKTTFTYRSSS